MRHRTAGRQLNRNASHRTAMWRNMAISLVKHELIRTTLPKAKELRRYAEPLITLAKNDSVANRRLAFSRTRSKEAVGKLFTELGPRYKERPGRYIRFLPVERAMPATALVRRRSASGWTIVRMNPDLRANEKPGTVRFLRLWVQGAGRRGFRVRRHRQEHRSASWPRSPRWPRLSARAHNEELE